MLQIEMTSTDEIKKLMDSPTYETFLEEHED